MEFTKDEKEFAEKYVQNLERYAKQWVWLRILLIILVVVVFGTSYYGYMKIQELSETFPLNFTKSDQPATFNDLIMVNKAYSRQTSFLMDGQLLLALCIFSGFFLIAIIIAEWNRHKKNLLLVKFIKTVLHNQK